MTEQETEREEWFNNELFKLRGVELENKRLRVQVSRLEAKLNIRNEISDPPDEDVVVAISRICYAAYPNHDWELTPQSEEPGNFVLELLRDSEGFIVVTGDNYEQCLRRMKGALMGVVYADRL